MKKIITAAFTLFVLTTVHAQTPSETDAAITLADPTVVRPNEVYKKTTPYSVHIKAVRNLYDRYGDANNETWYSTDYGFRAKFRQDGISFMADYNKRGEWLNTIKTYDETRLPKGIRRKVRQEYYDYHIFLVQEFNRSNETVYLVKIEDARNWKTLRVTDDGTEVLEDYVK